MSILLREGRKEDLKKKYAEDYVEQDLDIILNDPTLQSFNHKYTDWFLKNLKTYNDFDMMFNVGLGLISDFNKYGKNLRKTDINQYVSFEELEEALVPFKQKEKEKELAGQAEKVYEDDRFLVIVPKTEEASCKYGSNTKWCVTQKGKGHFETYTRGAQLLFFIIDKKQSTDEEFSKIAVHYTSSGEPTYWDSKDFSLNSKEIRLLTHSFPEMFNTIKSFRDKTIEDPLFEIIYKTFNEFGSITYRKSNFLNSKKDVILRISGFENAEHIGDNHAQGFVNIYLEDELKKEETVKLDSYDMFMVYKKEKNLNIILKIDFVANDSDKDIIDLGLDGMSDTIHANLTDDLKSNGDVLRKKIANLIYNEIFDNPNLIKKVVNNDNAWLSTYGYKFKSPDKGMIKKLVDYLDNNGRGTKLDFLLSIDRIETRKIDGVSEYRLKGKERWTPISTLRGYLSTFFAAATDAGIIKYQKEGNKSFIVKGPNFDKFKSGKLKGV